MKRFEARAGQFWLDDQPQFVQAGEFHYFRTPPDQWRHRLNLLKDAGFNAVASYIPWLWHQLEEDVSDFDGRSHPRRNLAGFLDLAREMGLLIIARPGPYIMAETINEGIPPWVFSKYPQVALVSRVHTVQNIASYLHPQFLACVAKWYRAVFEVLAPRQIAGGGNIILIQLDNEMGMMQWVRNILDANPDTLARFATYLQTTYGSALPHRYPVARLTETLRETLLSPAEPYADRVVDDYRRFYRGYLRDYAASLWSEAKACGMEVLPVINIHGFANGGKTFPIGLSQLSSVIAMEGMVSATDVYPLIIGEGNFHELLLVNEMTRALQNPHQPLFSIEFQAGGNQDFSNSQSSLADLHSRLCISCGMRAINHYLFFDGENDPVLSPTKRHDWGHPVRKDGSVRKHYRRYRKLSQVLAAYGPDLVLARPQTVTGLGFVLDDFMTEVNNEFTQEAAKVITHQRETILFDLIARGLALTHRPFEAIELSRHELNATRTPVCWVMIEKQCPAAIQQKLVDYVRQGGRLILIGRMCTAGFNHVECTILKDALSIREIKSDLPFARTHLRVFDYRDVPASFVESYTGEFEAVFAAREAGEAVGFVQRLGKGRALMLGAAFTANTLDDLDILHQMALEMDCPPLFRLSHWADVRLSREEKGSFLFLNNYQDDPVETTVEYAGRTLFGGNTVHIPARRGLILPLDWQLNPEVTLHYSTSEVIEKTEAGSRMTLKVEPGRFYAELTLTGYRCDQSQILAASGATQRVRVSGADGVIVLERL